ncbi:MAG: potassium transporter TrkG [Chloroflexota bacterium]
MVLIYGFAAVIAAGTILLMLPVSSRTGEPTPPVNALFTATSAVCVTGLVVVDTGSYWSPFGQTVLLILFQVGGFGFMTSASIIFMAMGRRIGLRERLFIGQSMGTQSPGGMVRLVRESAKFTLMAEGAGTIFLFLRFLIGGVSFGLALWRALFHAVSAFTNCGMDILGDFKSLADYQKDPVVLLTIAVLFILGGIGYIVVADVFTKRSFGKLLTDSKIVLVTTASLLIFGTIFILWSESSNTLGVFSLPQKLLISFFQSATPRSAGFTAIDIGKMREASLFLVMFLMFIGGASGSTAGGVKVSTLGVLIAAALNSARGREGPVAFGRQIPPANVYRALALVIFCLGLVSVVVPVLSLTEGFGFVSLLFEAFSALSTVGLTTGITPGLSVAGRLVVALSMFVGRLGPLVFISVITGRQQPIIYHYPKDNIRLG